MGRGSEWKIIHDLKAYLVYRQIKEGGDKNKLCEDLSEDEDFKNYIHFDSIKMKIENYNYIDKKEGLENYSKQSEKIFKTFKDWSIQEIKAILHHNKIGFIKTKNDDFFSKENNTMNDNQNNNNSTRMTKEEKKQKILAFLNYFSGHFGSAKINQALGIEDNPQHSITHNILQDLEKEGKVEQCHGKGFRVVV